MQLWGSWGLCDPGPVARRGAAIPRPKSHPGGASGLRSWVEGGRRAEGGGEGGGRRGGQGQARVEFFSQLLQTGVPRFLIQSDGHFSGEGAEPPNFRQEPPPHPHGRGGGEAKCWGGRLIVAQREGEGPGASLQRLTALTGPH